MNRAQVQQAVKSRGLSRKGLNQYTQGSKRYQVATGWSDCSSFARWCYLMTLGIDIGSYTGAQVTNSNMATLHKGGKYPDLSVLEVGSLIYFKNSTSSYAYGVSHVEVLIKKGKTLADCKILGHGGGKGPTEKNLKAYCDSRTYLMTRQPKVMEKTWTLGERIISLGAFGEDVYEMQRGLQVLGYPLGVDGPDWDCGDATDTAIRKFQRAYGLGVDGQFGPKSLAKFRALLAEWEPATSTEPLTEDDYPGSAPDSGDGQTGDAPTDPDGEGDGETGAVISPEADGSMGAGLINPYPQPAKIKRKGSSGAAVKWIQWELRQSGFGTGKFGPHKDGIDGDFGAATDKAVRKFQKAHKLTVDGEVGPKTIAALLAETGVCAHAEQPAAVVVDQAGRVYDVSSYDGDIDFAKVVALAGAQRCEMLIIRAQASKLDAKLARNIAKCKQYGIKYGVYAYTYAGTAAAGRKDADLLYQRVIEAGGEPLAWVIDAEEGVNTKASVEAMRVQLRGHIGPKDAIWFYSFDSLVRSWASIMKNYDGVWSARWNTPDIAPGYKDYDLWQFGYTNVPGIRKTTDTSRRHPDKSLDQILSRRAAG